MGQWLISPVDFCCMYKESLRDLLLQAASRVTIAKLWLVKVTFFFFFFFKLIPQYYHTVLPYVCQLSKFTFYVNVSAVHFFALLIFINFRIMADNKIRVLG